MSINIGSNKISKIYMGEDLIMEGKTGGEWIQLKTNSTGFDYGSYAFFKYLGNNKAAIVFVGMYSNRSLKDQILFYPPEGYKITKLPSDEIYTLGAGSPGSGNLVLKNDAVYIEKALYLTQDNYSFASAASYKQGYPLIVDVEKI